MQESGRVAQGSRDKSCSVQAPADKRAEGLAIPSIESGRSSDGGSESVSFVVFLRRDYDQGQVGFDDTSSNDPGGHSLHGKRVEEGNAFEVHFPKLGSISNLEIVTILRRRSCAGLNMRDLIPETTNSEIKYFSSLCQSEICFLLRRRLKKTQKACADEMGISRYWFNMMEQGKAPCKTLVEYWSRDAG